MPWGHLSRFIFAFASCLTASAALFPTTNAHELRDYVNTERKVAYSWYEAERNRLEYDKSILEEIEARDTAIAAKELNGLRKEMASLLLSGFTEKRRAFFVKRGNQINNEFNRRRKAIHLVIQEVLFVHAKVSAETTIRTMKVDEDRLRARYEEASRKDTRWEQYRGGTSYVSLKYLSEKPLDPLPSLAIVNNSPVVIRYFLNGRGIPPTEGIFRQLEAAARKLSQGEPDNNLTMDSDGNFLFRGDPFAIRFYPESQPFPSADEPPRKNIFPEMDRRLFVLGKEALWRKRLLKLLGDAR